MGRYLGYSESVSRCLVPGMPDTLARLWKHNLTNVGNSTRRYISMPMTAMTAAKYYKNGPYPSPRLTEISSTIYRAFSSMNFLTKKRHFQAFNGEKRTSFLSDDLFYINHSTQRVQRWFKMVNVPGMLHTHVQLINIVVSDKFQPRNASMILWASANEAPVFKQY